jgi:hypothetical protein
LDQIFEPQDLESRVFPLRLPRRAATEPGPGQQGKGSPSGRFYSTLLPAPTSLVFVCLLSSHLRPASGHHIPSLSSSSSHPIPLQSSPFYLQHSPSHSRATRPGNFLSVCYYVLITLRFSTSCARPLAAFRARPKSVDNCCYSAHTDSAG